MQAPWERTKLALELRQKFEMYFVAVSFTVAGLSVQTAKPPSMWWIEAPGWFCMLAAGALGLWRINDMWRAQTGIAEDASARARGDSISEEKKDQIVELETGVRKRFKYQFWMLVVGLALVMLSRAMALTG